MSTGTTTQDQKSNSSSMNMIPTWLNDAGQKTYAYAEDVANRPLQQFQGEMVAPVAPQTQQAWDLAASSGNTGTDQYNGATAGYLGALSQTPMQVNAGGPTMSVNAGGPTMQVSNPGNANAITAAQVGNTDLGKYMNPYTSSVINSTLPIMEQELGKTLATNAGTASQTGAFGGSRFGVQQGVAQAQGALGMTNMAAGLNQANFDQAQKAAAGDVSAQNAIATQNQNSQQTDYARQLQAALANQGANAADLNRSLTAQQSNQSANAADLTRGLTAQTANQTAQQNKINSDIAASSGLTSTGDSMNKANLGNWSMLMSSGQQEQGQAQNIDNANMQKFQDAWNYPSQGLNTMLSAENMTPHDTATSGSGTSQTQTSSTPNWAALGMDLLNTGASLWKSDEKLKKDISSMGADPSTGVPIKSFRYKGQSPTAPKIVGPLAQDVEQAIPGSTVKVKGALTVPGPILKAATPSVSAKPSFVTKASKPVAMMGAKTMPRAGARGVSGALANTARRTSRAGLIGALG